MAPPIESTLPQAINRLFSLERKFRCSTELKQQYEAFLDDYSGGFLGGYGASTHRLI